MFRKIVVPYFPPIIVTAVIGTIFLNELEQNAPEAVKAKILEYKPSFLVRKKSLVSNPEFSGDGSPQRGVFLGGDRRYCAVLVLSHHNNNATLQERKSLAKSVARSCVNWEQKDVDMSMGVGTRVWDAIKGYVPLGNTAFSSHLSSLTGGDVMVHIKADSQSQCAQVVESVLEQVKHQAVGWSEDFYGFEPFDVKNKPICPRSRLSSSLENCQVAVIPHVGISFALYQRWEEILKPSTSATKPVVSNHASRMFGLDEDGNKLRILKNTLKTGRLGSKAGEGDRSGMLFVAYCANPKIFEYMVERMSSANKNRGGVDDTILSENKCTRSQLFLIPSRTQVHALAT